MIIKSISDIWRLYRSLLSFNHIVSRTHKTTSVYLDRTTERSQEEKVVERGKKTVSTDQVCMLCLQLLIFPYRREWRPLLICSLYQGMIYYSWFTTPGQTQPASLPTTSLASGLDVSVSGLNSGCCRFFLINHSNCPKRQFHTCVFAVSLLEPVKSEPFA